ncbi:MAG: c-type cytochrome [Burkholderiales bacterium]|nr:c-type cytochrome [Burkholderiales bacterium]
MRAAMTGAIVAAVVGCGQDAHRGAVLAADARAGQAALYAYDCGVCHRIPGVAGAHGAVGPSLEAFGKRIYVAGRLPNTQAMLVRWIIDPPAIDPLTSMPAIGVDEAHARDMAAYLLSLR